MRLVDELPLLSQPDERRGAQRRRARHAARRRRCRRAASAAAPRPPAAGAPSWRRAGIGWSRAWSTSAQSLVRVTRIDQPEAMLVAPEQAFFLRENLKLRLLNARLALLSRQFDTAQADLRDAQLALDRYFDRSSRACRPRSASCCGRSARRRAAGRRAAARRDAGRAGCRGRRALSARHGLRHDARRHLARAAVRCAAVVAATTLGRNDGLVSLFYGGWRIDLSLNLFVIGCVAGCVRAADGASRALNSLVSLPHARQRLARAAARARRAGRAARGAGRVLRRRATAARTRRRSARWRSRPAHAELARRPRLARAGAPAGRGAACTGCRTARGATQLLRQALKAVRRAAPQRPVDEGARLLAAEWALDDRDAARALELLAELPPGVARRTQALRLKLQAARLARQPLRGAAAPRACWPSTRPSRRWPRRACCARWRCEALDAAHDADQLRRAWGAARRGRPARCLRGRARRAARGRARCAATTAATGCGRSGSACSELGADERAAGGAGADRRPATASAADWLPRTESGAAGLRPRGRRCAAAVGAVFAERQLWGKARRPLEQAAPRRRLEPAARAARAWRALARAGARGGRRGARAALRTGRGGWIDARARQRAAILSRLRAAVAQLDRVLGYEPRGRGFESCQPHQIINGLASFEVTRCLSGPATRLCRWLIRPHSPRLEGDDHDGVRSSCAPAQTQRRRAPSLAEEGI